MTSRRSNHGMERKESLGETLIVRPTTRSGLWYRSSKKKGLLRSDIVGINILMNTRVVSARRCPREGDRELRNAALHHAWLRSAKS